MPKYQFPLSDQDDYKGRILFTTIIETPASIDQAALDRVQTSVICLRVLLLILDMLLQENL
jgi:hypothetical protein